MTERNPRGTEQAFILFCGLVIIVIGVFTWTRGGC